MPQITFGQPDYFMSHSSEDAGAVRLSRLPKGRRAHILRHDEEGELHLQLLEMGCVPGEPVWIEMIAPLGDPLAISIAGYYLSIRRKEADRIWVELE